VGDPAVAARIAEQNNVVLMEIGLDDSCITLDRRVRPVIQRIRVTEAREPVQRACR